MLTDQQHAQSDPPASGFRPFAGMTLILCGSLTGSLTPRNAGRGALPSICRLSAGRGALWSAERGYRREACNNVAVRVVLVLADDPAVDDGGLRRAVRSALAATSHDVDVIDLHESDFSAAMTAAGRRAYHSGQALVEPDVADFGPRVRAAEALVFVDRAGWTGLSPRLKGFVDRTFVPGVGFHLVDGRLRRGLTGVRRLVAITVHERSRHEVRRSRDSGRRILLRTMRLIVAPRCRRRFVALYETQPERAAAARRRFDTRLDRTLGRL